MAAGTITREREVIDAAQITTDTIARLEVERLQLAVEWVLLHPGDEVDTSVEWAMRDLEIAGDGAPTIDEGAVAEFALAIGISTDSGRIYLGDAVELAYRLPRIWAKVTTGQVPVWKARKVAQATKSLPLAGAAYVDRALYFFLRKCSFAEIERQVEKARAEFDPAAAEERRAAAAERRHVKTYLNHMTSDGLVPIGGMLDLADAVAFEDYVSTEAARLDPAIPLDVRRSMVLGMLGRADAERQVVLYAHVRPDQVMVDVDNTRSVITPDHLREWCQAAGTKVVIKPVIDLNEEITTDTYQPSPRLAEQVRLRFPECVFPSCHRPSSVCDLDHIIPWPIGPTAWWNLAPLCRGHHRLKTHTDWDYWWEPGTGFVWTDPSGHRHTG